MHRHSPSCSPIHSFSEASPNLSKAAILLRVYLLYLFLSAVFLGFLWGIFIHSVEEPVAAAVYSFALGGPFVLLFSLVPHRFSMVYYPAPSDYKVLHFFAALWFGITAGRAAPLTNWLCKNLSRLYLARYRPSEKDQPREISGRSSLVANFTRETSTD